MAKENLSIQIEYEKKEGGVVLKKLHGRCAELHVPAKIDGLPSLRLPKGHLRQKRRHPMRKSARRRGEPFLCDGATCRNRGGAGIAKGFPAGYHCGNRGVCLFGCAALERVHLPERLTAVSKRMFDGCGALQEISLPRAVRSIGDYAFYGCERLKELRLPESVESIGRYAFYNCRRMEKINIPLAARELNTGLFLNCDSLKHLSFGRCRHISDLISGLNHELQLSIDFPIEGGETKHAELVLPDFQYEYIEDTPARLFHQVNYRHGAYFPPVHRKFRD